VATPTPAATPTAPSAAPNLNMVGGAPLSDPDVSVHIVQRKVLSDKGRHEVVLFPVVAQINGKFTNHLGLAAEYLYHFQENVALQVSPNFFYSNGESSFNEDLVRIARLQAQAATALTMQWGGEVGIEATPIYGKFAFYEGTMASFSLVFNAGVGITSTRVQLRPSDPGNGADIAPSDAVFGDTGFKFLGNVGGGFRIKVGEHFAIRLEVRDLVYTASVSSVNGCDASDLDSIIAHGGALNASCKADKFPTDAATGEQPDASLAKALLKVPSSDVLNQVAFYGGVAYIF
jgi:outer membrane beta-barrel protein